MSSIQHSLTENLLVNQTDNTTCKTEEKKISENEIPISEQDNNEVVHSKSHQSHVSSDPYSTPLISQSYSEVTPSAANDIIITKATDTICPFPISIENVKTPTHFTYYTERYFSQFLVRDCKGVEGNNARLLLHSNMLVVLCLDPSHTLVRDQLEITYLGHSARATTEKACTNDNNNKVGKYQQNKQSSMKVQGKKKRNATLCQKEMILCFIETKCEKKFKIPASVDGMLLELNTHIITNPVLVQRFPLQEGYLAIINPLSKVKFEDFELVSASTSGGMMRAAGGCDAEEEFD